MKRAQHQPETKIHIVGGIFIKEHLVPDAGTLLPMHSHRFAHATVLATGSIRAWCGGELMGEFQAPYVLHVQAAVPHEFLTLADGVALLCVHAIADGEDEPEVVAEHHLELED